MTLEMFEYKVLLGLRGKSYGDNTVFGSLLACNYYPERLLIIIGFAYSHKPRRAAQLTRCDQLIDAIVYRLYALTEAEIAIVEG